MKNIQISLLEFLDDESNSCESFYNLIIEYKIIENSHKFKSILQIINNICSFHHRTDGFINKITQILIHYKKYIQQFFSNLEIFEIFKANKGILLFLIQENMLLMDECIFSRIISRNFSKYNYIEYFAPEIKPFLTEEFIQEHCNDERFANIEEIMKEKSNDFYEKRKEGENDDYLCKIIRWNDIDAFIVHVNQVNISLQSLIPKSIFETNQFLFDFGYRLLTNTSKTSFIEYAAYCGSLDIIKYMHLNGVELTPRLWNYSIHSRNVELIRYLEENKVSPPVNDYNEVLKESIKCHHNDISNYIIDNYIEEDDLKNQIENDFEHNLYYYGIEYYNYCFFPSNIEYKNWIFYLCQFDYFTLVNLYLQQKNININVKIKTLIFDCISK